MVYGALQKCNFVIGPSCSWFFPSNADTWTQPKGLTSGTSIPDSGSEDDAMDCFREDDEEAISLSYLIYGSIGCFCYGEIHHHHHQVSKRVKNHDMNSEQPAQSLSTTLSHLIDIREDNSRVVCTRFLKTSRRPLVMILTENGSLLLHDCISNQALVHFKKSELLNKFHAEPEMRYEETSNNEHSNKKPRFDSMHQFSSCLWPHVHNAFLAVSLPKKKTNLLFWLKLKDLISVDGDHQEGIQKNDIIQSYIKLDLKSSKLPQFPSPICCMESMMVDSAICLIAVAMDDGLIVVIKVDLDKDQQEDCLYTLSRHREQVCSLSFLSPSLTQMKFPLGLLASSSRDGIVVIWDIENEHNLAYHTASVDDGRGQRGNTKINWFALKFITLKHCEQVYLAVSNSFNNLTVLKVPKDKPRNTLKLENKEKHQKRKHGAQQALTHHGVIFNISFDSATRTLVTTSIDGNILLWKCQRQSSNDDNTALELTPEYLYPTMADNSRTHMMRYSPIKTDFMSLALGKGGVRFYKISQNQINNRFDMNSSCNEISRKLTKASLSPTSVAWNPHREYRLAIGTLEGKVLRVDLTPRKASLVQSEDRRLRHSKAVSEKSDDIFDVEYTPLERGDHEPPSSTKKPIESGKTDGVYSIAWGPDPCCPQDISKLAIYAIGSMSHRLFIYENYESKKESGDDKEKLRDYLEEFSDQSLPEAVGESSEVAWKSSMDLMALGTTTGKIIVLSYLDESHADRSRNQLFQKLAVIQGPLGHTYIQCLVWHPSTQEDDPRYYQIAASANESPAFVFNIKESLLVADVKTRLKIQDGNGSEMKLSTNVVSNYVHKIDGHKKPITDIAWSPHKPDELATSSFDKYAYVWTLNTSGEVKAQIASKFGARHRLFTIEWSLVDQDLIFTSGQDSTVWAWRPSENRTKN